MGQLFHLAVKQNVVTMSKPAKYFLKIFTTAIRLPGNVDHMQSNSFASQMANSTFTPSAQKNGK